MNARKKHQFTEVAKEVPAATILEHCRTVVEKRDFVSTGIMTYAEGDMLEVEISDYTRFDLGESVKLTVYTPAGIYVIPSTIVGKDYGSLMMINPPENQRKFAEKRAHPRVEVSTTGVVAAVAPSGGAGQKKLMHRPVPFQVKNISLSGIGFTMPKALNLDHNSHVELELNLGTMIPCVAEIIRSESSEEGIYYGARYVQVSEDKLNSLRAYILREQISAHSVRKRSEDRKRMFK